MRCLQSFRVVDSPVVLPSREYFASWRDETFSCRRVFGRAANKDVELFPVFSSRISVRVVVHVMAVTNCDCDGQFKSSPYITSHIHHVPTTIEFKDVQLSLV